jgi:steroid 5-alpha reductase family enzyme
MINSMMDTFIFALQIVFGLQVFFFIFAALFKTDKLTDLSYGLSFVILAWILFEQIPTPQLAHTALLAMISLWGLRLSSYLFVRIMKTGKDKRFDGIRERFFAFAQFWFLQAVSIWVIMLPSIFVFGQREALPINYFSYLGALIFVIGLCVETIADWQKFLFKNERKNADKLIMSGIWKYSRHPNYFGEMCVWWGIFIFCFPAIGMSNIWLIVGPVFISSLLLFVTGIPPLEKKYAQKYKNDKNYLAYKKSTSLLVPWISIKKDA